LATYGIQEPAIYLAENEKAPLVQAYFAATGHTSTAIIHRADIATLSSGVLARPVTAAPWFLTTPANLAYVIHDEAAVWASSTTGAGAPPGGAGIGSLFGATQVPTVSASNLLPAEPGQVHVNSLKGGQQLEFTLDPLVAWTPTSQINAACYLYLDSASNLFYVSTTAGGASQFGVINNVVVKGQQGQVGDFGVRVLVSPLSTVVI